MSGVVGGVSGRQLDAGQAPVHYPDLLSASTTILQSGGGGFARLSNALQALDQSGNIVTLANTVAGNTSDIATLQSDVTTLQTQVGTLTGRVAVLENRASTLEAQVATLQGQVSTLQGQISTLQGQVAAQQVTINSFNYQQFEVSTGTLFLDQRTVYKRSIVINNALDTALTNAIRPHAIANINYIVNVQAMAAQAGGQQLPLTFLNMAAAPSINTGVSIWADTTNIIISVGTTTFVGFQVLCTLWYTATDR